jgi:hypothetical protein
VMRQHKAFFVLAGFICLLGMTSCGSSKSATPSTNSQNGTVHVPQPARATPSASAKLICAPDTQHELAVVLGVHTTKPVVATWIDHTYSCRYTYHNAFMVLSVKELSSKAQTDSYFTSLAHRLGQTQQPRLLYQGLFFTTKNSSVVVRKDYKVLLVNTSGLPTRFGAPSLTRADFALAVAATIMQCWTGA